MNWEKTLKAEKEAILGHIKRTMAELKITEVKTSVKDALDLNVSAVDIVDAIAKGLEEVGAGYESGEYFLTELVLAGNIAAEVAEMLKPYLSAEAVAHRRKVAIGTVSGDIHTIGKTIVIAMLQSAGFTVIDLGEDVPAERFLEAVKKEKVEVLALSGLLTIVIGEMRRVIDELGDAGLRDKVKVIVGGRPLTKEIAEELGADGYGRDAVEAVSLTKKLLAVE